MELSRLLFINALVISGAMTILWLISLRLRDASIVDPFWGAGLVVVVCNSFALVEKSPQSLLIVLLTSLWGLRLSGYLLWRNWGKTEDYRYRAMRDHHGRSFPFVSFLTVFALQGFVMWIVSLPLQVGIAESATWSWTAVLGVLIWLLGVVFESVGDFQLARFKSNPENRGRVMDKGLWRYTRHPNYFGDFCVWWGLYFVSLTSDAWWWTIISPVLMSFLLLRVSGVTLLERSLKSRVQGYEEYAARTSAFFPLPPRQTPKTS